MKTYTYAAFAALFVAVAGSPSAFAQSPKMAEPTLLKEKAATTVGLKEAIAKALASSPRLKSADAAVAGAVSVRSQADAWINPNVSLDAENIGGTGPYSSFRSGEMTAGVSQLIEIGGKRSARIDMADREHDAVAIERRIAEADLIRDVSKAYAVAAAAQEEVALRQSQVVLAEEMLTAVSRRVAAAAEPVIQESKAKVAHASAKIGLEKARRNASGASRTLALLIGEAATVQANAVDLYSVAAPPALDAEAALMNALDFQYNATLLAKANSAVDVERASAVPDPTLNAGMRQLRDDDEQAFLVGLSIPLPLFNLNRGNIERAKQDARRADADRLANLQTNLARLEEHRQALQAAYSEIGQIKEAVLPQAEAAFIQALRGYNAGKFAYLEVLDAQRTLADSKLSHLAALREYHTNKAEIDRLIVGATNAEERPK